jgi:hypothetical protein
VVSGYFDSREKIWTEPLYRNIWGLLREFGDAELATLIAPRGLVVEFSKGPLEPLQFQSVKAEFDRIDTLIEPGFQPRRLTSGAGNSHAQPLAPETLQAFAQLLGVNSSMASSAKLPKDMRPTYSPDERQHRLVIGLENHAQALMRGSDRVREKFFLHKIIPALADEQWNVELRQQPLPVDTLVTQAVKYRQYYWNEVLGRIDDPVLPPNPRSRQILNSAKWTGYDVVLDVWPESFAWGVLLLPKDLKAGERRPVVVCQHGRNNVPIDTVQGDVKYYHDFATKLADQGYIVFAPHGLFRNESRYRPLNRKANTVKVSLFSFVAGHHQQILRWLGTLPMVDSKRIALYGLSFGGETAMRVPAVLPEYCLSICSADFNSWTRKVARADEKPSFVYSDEGEVPSFNMGNTFDHSELAALMIPRPFMVERGHQDRVAKDSWVAYEYAKVRRLYTQFGLADKTEIEFFEGGHTINAQGTFRFLNKHLRWPEK